MHQSVTAVVVRAPASYPHAYFFRFPSSAAFFASEIYVESGGTPHIDAQTTRGIKVRGILRAISQCWEYSDNCCRADAAQSIESRAIATYTKLIKITVIYLIELNPTSNNAAYHRRR